MKGYTRGTNNNYYSIEIKTRRAYSKSVIMLF